MQETKIYKHLEKVLGPPSTEVIYQGTILDFCLECLASRMSFDQIKERYITLWPGSNITEEDIIKIIEGHEKELHKRKEDYAKLIRSSLYINIILAAMNLLIQDAHNAKTPQQRAQTLSVLNNYLKFFVQTEDNKAVVDTIKQKLSHDEILNFILENKDTKENFIRETPKLKIKKNTEKIE